MPHYHFVHGLLSGTERVPAAMKYRAAPGTATTGNRANDTPVQSQSERESVSSTMPSQVMRTADREPAGGEIPVELVAASRLMTSHSGPGCRGQIGLLSYRPDSGTYFMETGAFMLRQP